MFGVQNIIENSTSKIDRDEYYNLLGCAENCTVSELLRSLNFYESFG